MKKLKNRLCFCLIFVVAITSIFALVGCGSKIEKVGKQLSNYALNLCFDNTNKTLVGEENVDFVNSTDVVLSEVLFHLYPNAFRTDAKNKPVSKTTFERAYKNGFSAGKIDVLEVEVLGKQIPVEIAGTDENILRVELEESLYPNDRVNIFVKFCLTLPNVNHRFGFGENTTNFGNFYPIACVYENGAFRTDEYSSNGDPFYSSMANYNVQIEFPKDFEIACTGKKVEQKVENSSKKVKIEAQAVRDFAFVLSEKFEVLSAKAGQTEVFYYYYDDENAKQGLQTAVKAILTFNNLFGEYPYSTFSVAKANFVHGGMEYPNLVLISDEVDDENEFLNVIVHETAHQWWYNLVGSDAVNNAWLDEGLTEFSTLMFYRHNQGYAVDEQQSLNASLSSYLLFSEIYKSVYGSFDSSMSRPLKSFSGDMEYTYITYVKGVLFFDNLEELVGQKNFLKALKLYFKSNQFQIATPDKMIEAFEVVCKRNLEGFFDSWVNGKVVLQSYR